MKAEVDSATEITELKSKLDLMHRDIKRMMENSNKEYLDLMLKNLKKDFLNCITAHISEDIENSLERGMVEKCQMRETCKSKFTELLERNADLIKQDKVPETQVTESKGELNNLRAEAPFNKCDVCFLEVTDVFEKQLKLMRSLHIYNGPEEIKMDISDISEDILVRDVFEPLSNRQRLQIMKAVAVETKTFTSLSQLTGLRGGNLIFHIQKLLDSNMIIQRHERGDYMITEKGYKILKTVSQIGCMFEDAPEPETLKA
ncbi:winged helix-turn-helix domain-containing protein [Methanobacterium aggregans]|uniref:winged helix-turn-helix domain-containing protein n=1 Tax=Methanobacterium aggregans TaxID=1615586 RepID=UPI001AE861FF|nr:winged helix-turn-helix domain-containing protein [Methanobacterium aggregans]MBP2045004.1 putative transcriptional regulator [Methanobacterium aggregans]